MSWIEKPSTRRIAPPTRGGTPQQQLKSLEYGSRVSAKGVASSQAVIEQLSATECSFRSVSFFVPGDIVELEFGDDADVCIRGRVVSRASIGPRFSYTTSLKVMNASETDALARALADKYRREAMSRSLERLRSSLLTTENSKRASHRVLSQFPILFRRSSNDEAYKSASAGNISSTGLLMVVNDRLKPETQLDLRFTLPSAVLAAYPEETTTLDVRRLAIIRGPRPDERRPFEEMRVGARVATVIENLRGTFACGIEFTQIDGAEREEIARYVHAVQQAKRR